MSKIRTLYAVHHSHTDIGYTDLQERVTAQQVDYIRTAVTMTQARPAFRWNCETLYCVEQFFAEAAPAEQQAFLALAREGKIGLSANYLNFTDLVDCEVLARRLADWRDTFAAAGIRLHTAMCADINGLSMGQRDALLDAGVDFLFTNVHCHHGMYPLYQNQNAYFWQAADGRKLLVWNGEHYNLGNVLGLRPNHTPNFMTIDRLGDGPAPADDVEALHQNLQHYVTECEQNGYGYDFLVAAVSGVFSDNAPPEPLILDTIEAYNARYGNEVRIEMVSLQELAAAIAPRLADAPVYTGDFNDWWANGVGSTPYAVKHYLAARRNYALARRLDPGIEEAAPALARQAQDNLLLYAEHTWGHSGSITDPCLTMANDLDIRKTGYASAAHEAAAKMLARIAADQGDSLRYYATAGEIRVVNPSKISGPQPVEFYVETLPAGMPDAWVKDAQGREIPCQVSPHPRGRRISFVRPLDAGGSTCYTYGAKPATPQTLNTRKCYVGAERIRDIVNDYDPVSYKLPYGFENRWFKIGYTVGGKLTTLVDKRTGAELLPAEGPCPLLPVYEVTAVRPGVTDVYEERRLLGRNIRGAHAVATQAIITAVDCEERGPVFTRIRLTCTLPGAANCAVILQFYEDLPRIEVTLQLGKTMTSDIESVYLPLDLQLPGRQLWARKGGREAYRPGVDQLPGTGMEYTMSDDGLALLGEGGGVLVASYDVPLYTFGEMRHHAIKLCQNDPADNARPVASWLMNNTWETNFQLNLAGYGEFRYTLSLTDETDPTRAMDELHEMMFAPCVRMLK